MLFRSHVFGIAEDMIRLRVRRERPNATPEEVEACVDAWVVDRPGAENGDYSDGSEEPGSP